MENYTPEQLALLAKERPKNETAKRFILSKEVFSKERLEAVKIEVEEMRAKYPEVLSLCLFGSMVKGTAHEGSDIDGYLFIDSALVAQRENLSEEKILEQHPKVFNQIYLTEEMAQKYIIEFRDGLKEKTGLTDKEVEHIRSRPISEKVIEDEIAILLEYQINISKYQSDTERWIESRPPRGSNLEEFLAYERAKPERPEYVRPSLGAMFHLDVGNGIKKYRKLYIEKLGHLGPDGEKIWADTIKGTEMLENNLSTDDKKRYPRTLAEAVKVYG
ncbi:MAG TPA: nucleotidyltransferase domain-containing protein [Candidatus Paceibacterota bacterium]